MGGGAGPSPTPPPAEFAASAALWRQPRLGARGGGRLPFHEFSRTMMPLPQSLTALRGWFAEQEEPEATMEAVGLLMHDEVAHGGYWCTPTNSLAFASTGGNGVHFSFVDLGAGATDSSPIVMTVPMSPDPNWIVGVNLLDFLSLGVRSGYFGLEQLSYGSDLHAIGSSAADARAAVLLTDLGARLDLSTWDDAEERLHWLNERFGGRLEVKDDGDGFEACSS